VVPRSAEMLSGVNLRSPLLFETFTVWTPGSADAVVEAPPELAVVDASELPYCAKATGRMARRSVEVYIIGICLVIGELFGELF